MNLAVIAFTYLNIIPSEVFVGYSSLAFMHFFNKSTTDTLTKGPGNVNIDGRG